MHKGWTRGSNPAADILVIAGGGSGVKQLKLWSYTLSLKADPPSVIFLAFNSFKDNLDSKAPMQPEDIWIFHQFCRSNRLESSR